MKTVHWGGLAALIAVQIGYPLSDEGARTALVIVTVVLGWLLSVSHAAATRGVGTALRLVAVTTLGGLGIEAVGVHTGLPFGAYDYTGALGPRLFGVPVVIGLAWTWMAWPAALAAGRLTRTPPARVAVAAAALAAWDVFLDPQLVAVGYWRWRPPIAGLPGIGGVPLSNYLGWFAVALAMMALLGPRIATATPADGPMLALYLWTYASSVLAHAVFLGLPGSAAWGAVAMGAVAVPLALSMIRRRAPVPP